MSHERSNLQLVAESLTLLSKELDKNLFLLDNVLEERENIEYIDRDKYKEVLSLMVQLRHDSSDSSVNPKLAHDKKSEVYIEERKVLIRYAMAHNNFELNDKIPEAREAVISMLKKTAKTFDGEFLTAVNLLILFDGEHKYKHVCKFLAEFIIDVCYNEEKGEE